MSTRKIIGLTAGALMVAAGSIGAVAASAASPTDTSVCTVSGGVVVNGLSAANPLPAASSFQFTSTSISCTGGRAAGVWDGVAASGGAAQETCAGTVGLGSGSFSDGTNESNSDKIVGGTFKYHRHGTNVVVEGNITVKHPDTTTESVGFSADLDFIPTTGSSCAAGAGDPNAGQTTASMTGGAVIEDETAMP